MERSLPVDDGESSRKPPIVRRSATHLNPLVTASRFNGELWSNKNQLVIFHLDQGKKVREIAEIAGKAPRQIRVVRERLRDLPSAEPVLATARLGERINFLPPPHIFRVVRLLDSLLSILRPVTVPSEPYFSSVLSHSLTVL